MRFFDWKAFQRGAESMDDGTLQEDINEIGIVTSGMEKDEKEAFGNFIKFVALADDQGTDGASSTERLTFLELLEIGRHLNNIVQTLSGESSMGIDELARRIRNVKNSSGMRMVI